MDRAALSVCVTCDMPVVGSHNDATLKRPGMKSLSNCSRFALNSGDKMVRPVVFPPGRASDGMSPIPQHIVAVRHNRDRRGPLLGDAQRKIARRRNHGDLHSNQLSDEFRKVLKPVLGVSKLDNKIRTLDHSSFAQSLLK